MRVSCVTAERMVIELCYRMKGTCMEEKYLVSILCTAYNHEKYIRQTLESFLSQKTNFKYEIIVHDDASEDKTPEIIRELAAEHADIICPIYQKENQYKNDPDMLSLLVPKARGKYIAICEGDDYWTDPGKLQMQVDWLETHPDYSACVHNSIKHWCSDGEESLYNTVCTEDSDLGFKDIVGKVGSVFHYSSIVGRTVLFEKLPDFYETSIKYRIGDHPLAIWLSLNGKIRYFNKAMSLYRLFSIPLAWSSQTQEISRTIFWLEGSLAMLATVRPHIHGDDKVFLENALLRYEWEMLQAKGEYSRMKESPYDVLYRQAPVTQRLWISFKQYFPSIYCMYMKLRGRENGIPESLRKR